MVEDRQAPNIEAGKELLKFLDKSRPKPAACLWFYLPDAKNWRLIISSQEFNKNSAKDNYENFIESFKGNKYVREIGLKNITLLPTNHRLLQLLKTAIKTDKNSIAGIRFTSNTINNVYIEDAYIYRLS